MAKSVFWVGSAGGRVIGPDCYMSMYGELYSALSEAQASTPIRQNSGSVSDLKTYVSANSRTTDSLIIVRKSGGNTGLSVTYGASQTGIKEDTINSFFADTSDELAYFFDLTEGGSGFVLNTITSTFDVAGDTSGCMAFNGGQARTTASPSETVYYSGGNSLYCPINMSEAYVSLTTNSTYTTSNLYGYVISNDKITTTEVFVRKNGVDGTQTIVWTSAQTGVKEDTSNTDSYVATDTFAVRFTTGADSSTIIIGALGVSISNSAVAGISYSINMSSGLISTGCTNTLYNGLSGVPTGAGGAVSGEAKAKSKIGFNCSATNYNTYVYYNTSSDTSSLQFRVNGVTTSLSVSYTAGQTGAKSDADVVSVIGETDFIDFQTVQGGTGAIYVTKHYLDTYVTKIFIPDIRMLMEL